LNVERKGFPLQSDNTQSGDRLDINIVENKDGALVYLSGRVGIDSSPAFRKRLLALIEGRRAKRVSVDLFAITQIDSSGIATLIEALKIAHAYQTELTLQGLHDDLLRLFEFTGILSLFNGSRQTIGRSGDEVV
jgi:anti-sigma B factor antagonist